MRAVTFDCWGTLITDRNLDAAVRSRIESLMSVCSLSDEEAQDLLNRGWKAHHEAWLGATQYGSAGIARFCVQELGISDPVACERLQEAFEEAGRAGELEALPGAEDTLRTLREAGIRTALVCDAGFTPGRVVRDFLDELGLLQHLESCAFSNEVGVPKPHPRIFREALDAIETPPLEAVHVGDLLRTDVHGARSLGMKTVRITAIGDDAARGFSWDPSAGYGADRRPNGRNGPRRAPFEEADAVVSSHGELPGALRDLGVRLD